MSETVALTLRLPTEIHERLRAVAFQSRTSITALIVAALDPDALAARDAVRDKTVRATALREAADDFAEREGVEALMFANDNIEAVRDTETWLRVRADQEEL